MESVRGLGERIVQQLASRAAIPLELAEEILEKLGEEHKTFKWPLTRIETELLLARSRDV